MARRYLRWVLPSVLGVLAVAAFAGAAVASGEAPALKTKPRRPRGISPRVYALAEKWAVKRGLPLQWVLATILVESQGREKLMGDDGRSYGLMQINAAPHADRLKRYGLQPSDLLDANNNLMIGTEILREAWQAVANTLGTRKAPAPLDVLVRYAYVGPFATRSALRRGLHPRETEAFASRAPIVEGRWSRALAQTTAVV